MVGKREEKLGYTSWVPPSNSWVKFNVDGTSKGKRGMQEVEGG